MLQEILVFIIYYLFLMNISNYLFNLINFFNIFIFYKICENTRNELSPSKIGLFLETTTRLGELLFFVIKGIANITYKPFKIFA